MPKPRPSSTTATLPVDPFLFEPVKALWQAVDRLNDIIGPSADSCGCGYCYCHGGGCNCSMCLAMPQVFEELEQVMSKREQS